ncbi:MAG: hypothetical protein ACI89L_000028 [Phycisphaerales bacterium]|jgi:hypothetical protein
MARLLVILVLLVAGLRPGAMLRPGSSPAALGLASMSCCELSPAPPPPPMSCCEEEAAQSHAEKTATPTRTCQMTGGECECFNRPADAPTPLPQAPKPLSGVTLILAPVSIETVPAPAAPSVCSARPHLSLLGLVRQRSQNETQALLGVWQT